MNQLVNSRPTELLQQKNLIASKEGAIDPAIDSSNTLSKPTNKQVVKESSYWNNFYAGKFDIAVPSQFCVLVATEADKSRPVVEFGCGNGRDSIYFARHGFTVFAGDLSKAAVEKNTTKEAECKEHHNPAQFRVCDVSSAKDVQSLMQQARKAAKDNSGNVTAYNRFFLHSLDDEQESKFLTALSENTVSGDVLYMEFRCALDANQEKLYKGHYRRYVETDKLVNFLETELSFQVDYEITGQGMAKYKTEDPFVSRIVATRR